MNVNAFADNITLHTKNLTISTEKIRLFELQANDSVENLQNENKDHSEAELKIRKFNFLPKNDYLVISPVNILSKFRKYVVKIPFEGTLDSGLLGYYRSSYFDKSTSKKVWVDTSNQIQIKILTSSTSFQMVGSNAIWAHQCETSVSMLW